MLILKSFILIILLILLIMDKIKKDQTYSE